MDQFKYNIDELVEKTGYRKDTIKRCLKNSGQQQDKDFIIQRITIKKKERGGHNKEIILLTKECYDQIVYLIKLRSRKQIALHECEPQYVKRYMPKETETLGFLCNVFDGIFEIKLQYKMLHYRVDMYIVNKNVVIECDEHNHRDRDMQYEVQRQQDIIKSFNCTFIRFNPDDPNFKISELVNRVLKHVSMS